MIKIKMTTPPSLSVDASFGASGLASGPLILGQFTSGPFIAYDSGTTVVASSQTGISNYTINLTRFNAAGTAVASSSTMLTQGFNPSASATNTVQIRDIMITANRKIVVAYFVSWNIVVPPSAAQNIYLAQFTTALALDTLAFGVSGVYARTVSTSPLFPLFSITPLYDGDIGLAYQDSGTLFFGRIPSSGASTAGSNSTASTGQPNTSVTQPDGKLLSANGAGSGIQLWRRNNDATLTSDATFGGGTGVVFWSTGSITSTPTNIGIDQTGRIYVGLRFATNDFFGVVRFNSDGTLDNTFGVSGLATGSTNKAAVGLTFLWSGGMVAIGGTPAGNQTQAIGFGTTGTAGALFSSAIAGVGPFNTCCTGVDGSIFVASLAPTLRQQQVVKLSTSNGGPIPTLTITQPSAGQIATGQPFTGTTGSLLNPPAIPSFVTGFITSAGYIQSAGIQADGSWTLPNPFPPAVTIYTLNVARSWTSRRCNVNVSTTFEVVVCLHGGALVEMADGSRKMIRDIAAGDIVRGADGREKEVDELAICWLKDPSAPLASRAAIIEPGAFGENLPTQRLIIDIGHPIGRVEDFGERGLAALHSIEESETQCGGLVEVARWDELYRYDPTSGPDEKRYDLILKGGPSAYIANGLAVRSRDSHSEAGYVHDLEG